MMYSAVGTTAYGARFTAYGKSMEEAVEKVKRSAVRLLGEEPEWDEMDVKISKPQDMRQGKE